MTGKKGSLLRKGSERKRGGDFSRQGVMGEDERQVILRQCKSGLSVGGKEALICKQRGRKRDDREPSQVPPKGSLKHAQKFQIFKGGFSAGGENHHAKGRGRKRTAWFNSVKQPKAAQSQFTKLINRCLGEERIAGKGKQEVDRRSWSRVSGFTGIW